MENKTRKLAMSMLLLTLYSQSESAELPPCRTIMRLVDSGRLEDIELPDVPSIIEHYKGGDLFLYTTDYYATSVDINGDGYEDWFINSFDSTDFRILNPDNQQMRDITAVADPINPVQIYGEWPKRAVALDGKTFIIVFNSLIDVSMRAVWKVTKDFKLSTVCEVGRFLRPNGTPYHRVLTAAESLARQAEEGGVDPWELVTERPGLAAFDAFVAAGWSLTKPRKRRKTYGSTPPIWSAFRANRLDIVKALLQKGVSPNVFESKLDAPYGEYLFGEAVRSGNADLVRILIKAKGLRALKGDASNHDQLAVAVLYGRIEVIDLLLEAGAAISDRAAVNWVSTPDPVVFEHLRKHGLDINKVYTTEVISEGVERIGDTAFSVGPRIRTKRVKATLLQWARSLEEICGDLCPGEKAKAILLEAGATQ